jgi:hypothetical protein
VTAAEAERVIRRWAGRPTGPFPDHALDILADAALHRAQEESTDISYVADYMAGRTRLWRDEAFRLAAKTGEPLLISAGVEHERLLAQALAALDEAPE